MKKLLFFGELPPNSINGIAYSNQTNIDILEGIFNVFCIEEYSDLQFHKKIHFIKFWKFSIQLIKVIKLSIVHNFEYCYIIYSNSPVGILKTYCLLIIFRTFNPKSKYVVHIHRGDLHKVLEFKKLYISKFKKILEFSTKIIVLSASAQEYLNSKFKVNEKVFVLSNTVHDEHRIETKNFNNNHIQCIYISNYIEEKGILFLLNCFSKINHKVFLNCYGNFTNDTFKSIVLNYESDKVKINGPITGYKKYLEIYNSDLLILPSFNEGLPLILLESTMMGTPFISTNIGYTKEVTYADYPFFFEVNDEFGFLKVFNSFLDLTILEKKGVSNNVQKYYFAHFSNDIHKLNLLKIFRIEN